MPSAAVRIDRAKIGAGASPVGFTVATYDIHERFSQREFIADAYWHDVA